MELFQDHDFDFAEVDWMAFGLKGNRPSVQLQLSVFDQGLSVRVLRVQLRTLVFKDDLAIEEMPNNFVAEDFELRCHPLIAMVGLRFRVGAVRCK